EWTEKTWNPVVGCTRCSQGCKNCYAFALHDMRHAAYQAGKRLPLQYAKPFTEIQLMEDRLIYPLTWRTPRMVFVNSMSDLFHEDLTDDFIEKVFAVMAITGQHSYQVLTKRAQRMLDYMNSPSRIGLIHAAQPLLSGRMPCSLPLPNVWLGVSVEDQAAA